VADLEPTMLLHASSNLLRTPLLLQILEDHGPVRSREALIATRAGSSPASEVIGRGGAVGPVTAPVAADLPGDGAAVTSEGLGDLGRPESLSSERGKLIPL
jgi:hypothetical protein